ncbi:hypothetical protein EJD97_020489, partial [Solanum chilense]
TTVDWHGSSGGYMRFRRKLRFMVRFLCLIRLNDACSHDRPIFAVILGVKAFELIMFCCCKFNIFVA